MVDVGQFLSWQDKQDMAHARRLRAPYFTDDEAREIRAIRAIRANPALWDDTPTSAALSARLWVIKALAESRLI